MKIYFYIENHMLETKWKLLNLLAEHLDKMGNTVLLYVADCSLFNEQRIYCETKIENADLVFFFGKTSFPKMPKVQKKVMILEEWEELIWADTTDWIDEIWITTDDLKTIESKKTILYLPFYKNESTNFDYFLKKAKGRQREEKIVIIALLDNFRYLGKLLSSFENYYCNIRVASEFIIFTDQKDIKKFRSEVYSKAIEMKSIRNIHIQSLEELDQCDSISICFWGKIISDPEKLFHIYQRGIPVISIRDSKDKKYLSSGVLLEEIIPEQLQRIFEILIEYPEIKKEICWNQYAKIPKENTKNIWLTVFSHIKETSSKNQILESIEEKEEDETIEIQVQGPFETSYSLAIINKKLAEALHRKTKVSASIGAMEATGEYEPRYKFLKENETAFYLWKKGLKINNPLVAIRNMYPPSIESLTASYNFEMFGWEEDRVPKTHIEDFNVALDGVGTLSEFVTKALVDSGLKIPVCTIGCGVELPNYFQELSAYPIRSKKKIKFLHISSAFPRKGVDLLLQAYCEEFTRKDDVCLILKTFPNPHNKVEDQIHTLSMKYPSMPEIELINKDLEQRELYSLYKAVDCYIHTARGEGFGLPVAEAMLAKVPVIVSNNTGLADFCKEDTALLVDFVMEKGKSHLSENSNWARPNKDTIKKRMREFVNKPNDEKIKKLVKNAYQLISSYYNWDAVADRWISFVQEIIESQKKPTVAMVTTWNTKCGIAEFTRYFIEATNSKVNYLIYPNKSNELIREDEEFVEGRYWDVGQVKRLLDPLQESEADAIHIQFNFGLLKLENLVEIILQCKNKKVMISFHGTNDLTKVITSENKKQVIDGLNEAYQLVVHQQQDRKNLMRYGILEEKISVIPLGQISYPQNSKEEIRKRLEIKSSLILGSYGFLFPHKGFEKVIQAVSQLKEQYPDILYFMVCSLYESESSKRYLEQCKRIVRTLGLEENVLLIHDFLKPEESMKLLQACDILLLPYNKTNESASGAVRFCVAAKRPIITTQQEIFSEYSDCIYQIKENTPNKIVKAVNTLMNEKTQKEYLEKVSKKAGELNWNRIGKKYIDLYSGKKIENI